MLTIVLSCLWDFVRKCAGGEIGRQKKLSFVGKLLVSNLELRVLGALYLLGTGATQH
jgi:hypothetical protein